MGFCVQTLYIWIYLKIHFLNVIFFAKKENNWKNVQHKNMLGENEVRVNCTHVHFTQNQPNTYFHFLSEFHLLSSLKSQHQALKLNTRPKKVLFSVFIPRYRLNFQLLCACKVVSIVSWNNSRCDSHRVNLPQ